VILKKHILTIRFFLHSTNLHGLTSKALVTV